MSRTLDTAIKSTLNGLLDESARVPVTVTAQTIRMGIEDPQILEYIDKCLAEWEASGFLRKLRDVKAAAPADVCVEIFSHIKSR